MPRFLEILLMVIGSGAILCALFPVLILAIVAILPSPGNKPTGYGGYNRR
jgi:hypothetical protein